MPLVNVPNVGKINFPDSMSPDDIKGVLDSKFGQGEVKKSALQSQMAEERGKSRASTLGQLLPAMFTPSDEMRASASEEAKSNKANLTGLGNLTSQIPTWANERQINSQEEAASTFHLPKISTPEFSSLTGLKGREASIPAAIQRNIAGIGEGLASPESALMFGAPGIAGKAIGAAFVASMAKAVPEQLSQAAGYYSAGDTAAGDDAIIRGLVTAGMIAIPAHQAMRGRPSLEELIGKQKADQIRLAAKEVNQNAIQKQGTGAVGAHPIGPESAGEGGSEGVGPGIEGQKVAGAGQEPRPATPEIPLKESSAQPFEIAQDEGGDFVVTDPAGNPVGEPHASHDAAIKARDELNSKGTQSSADAVIPPLGEGERLVTIERPDGTTYKAAYSGKFYDFGGVKRPSIARVVNGGWSHGIIGKGEKIIDSEPSKPSEPSPLLTKDEHAELAAVADDAGVGYRVESPENMSDNNPFAKGKGKEDHLATIDPKTGEIVVNGPKFSAYRKLAGSAKAKRAVTKSVAMEEVRHLATEQLENLAKDTSVAAPYWNSLGKIHQWTVHQRYNRGDPRGMSPQMLGYEAINFDMARLAKETPHQILTADYFDKLSLKSLQIIETVIRGIEAVVSKIPIKATQGLRERLLIQKAILGEVQRKVDLLKARKLASAGGKKATPSSITRNSRKLALQHADDLENQADEWEKNGGTKAEADEMRAQAAELRKQTFDDSFRPSAQDRRGRPKKRHESIFQEKFLMDESLGKPVAGTGAIGEPDQYVAGQRVTHAAGASEGVPGSGLDEGAAGGHLQGPFKDTMVESGETAMDKVRRTPLTDVEAQSLEDHITATLGRPAASPSDVRAILDAMGLTRPSAPVMAALRKIAAIYDRSFPDLSVDDLLNRMASGIYEDKTIENHIARSTKESPAQGGPDAGLEKTPNAGQVGRKIFNPIRRRPPTDVAGLPPGTPPEMTTAMPGQTRPEMLEPKDLEWVNKMIDDSRFKSALEKSMRNPSAFDRTKLKRALDYERSKFLAGASMFWKTAGSTLRRKENVQQLASSLDVTDTLSRTGGRQAGFTVRLESATKKNPLGNKDLLSGAMAYYSTGAIKARYKYSQEALNEADRLIKEDPEFKHRQDFIKSREADMARLASQIENEKNNLKRRDEFEKMMVGVRHDLELANSEINRNLNKRLLETKFLNHADATYSHLESAKDKLGEFEFRLNQGDEAARLKIKNGNIWDRYVGRKWLKSNQKLRDGLEFARVHWDNPELRSTAESAKREFDQIYDLKKEHGVQTDYSDDYLPGRYEDLVTKGRVFLGPKFVLGGRSSETKTFPTYYHAAQAGPYVPASFDIASLVESSVRQGLRSINKQLWWDQLKEMKDEGSGMMIAMPGKESFGHISAPTPDYVPFHTPSGGTTFVLRTYEGLIHQLVDPSAMTHWAVSRAALMAGQAFKHTVLMGDIFHLFRLMDYSLAISGVKARSRPGFMALEMREGDIPKALERGVIDKGVADWLNEKLPFFENGQPAVVSRIRLASLFQREGLNVGQIQDALYKDLVRNVPLFGRYNKWLFDKFTRGLMMDAATNEYARLSKLDPKKDSTQILREVSRDVNTFYGSIGRQGWIKPATFRDLARMILLAPQWQEGLIKKEMSLLRAVKSPIRSITGREPAFRAMARGMLSMFVLTQVINMIMRRHPTWQNQEEDHKWDAYIGNNTWLSPLALFNELTADAVRYSETKPKIYDAIQQIGENKLGFFGRAALVAATGRTPSGVAPSTSLGMLGAIASQMAPTPISFGPTLKAVGHKLDPHLIPPNRPGRLMQSIWSSGGFKTHRGLDAEQYVRLSAAKFRRAHGMSAPTMEYSDEPSYSEMRYNLKYGNEAGALKILKGLLKTRSPRQISVALHNWSRRPFTGSIHSERLWLAGMTPAERAQYQAGLEQRRDEAVKMEQWYHQVMQAHQPSQQAP